jgi:SAM-dependent methyltransferase
MAMTADFHLRLHERQEYLTPGEPETVARMAEMLRAVPRVEVLEVACGKGTAACVQARQTGCRVLALDPHLPFVQYAQQQVRARGLAGAVRIIRGDGRHVPGADETFDAGYCIGGPSIVGLEPCLRELRRTVRPAGVVVISDLYWRRQPRGPLGPDWGWVGEVTERPSRASLRRALERADLEVVEVLEHDRAAWEAYFRPMREVAVETRRRGDVAFAAQVERDVALEMRGVEAFHGYTTLVARRRPS